MTNISAADSLPIGLCKEILQTWNQGKPVVSERLPHNEYQLLNGPLYSSERILV